MSYPARRIPTPWESRKRKERNDLYMPKPSNPIESSVVNESNSNNRLIAGYMAHEFLTKGTLFGHKFDPARAEAVPVKLALPRKNMKASNVATKIGAAEPNLKAKPDRESYVEVASLLKNDGTHIPEIVNPSQLACWIRM